MRRFVAGLLWILFFVSGSDILAQIDWFEPAQGGLSLGIARLTNDPAVRDWANYHNTKSFSPDGRYVCFTRYASDGKVFGAKGWEEVHVFDLHTGQDQLIDNGHSPRWAQDHNWLFYLKYSEKLKDEDGMEVWWFDADRKRKVLMGNGVNGLGETSFDDRWLFGFMTYPGPTRKRESYRIAIRPDAQREYLPGLDSCYQWIPNPQHDVVFCRMPNLEREGHDAFSATRYWSDIDGGNIRIGSTSMNRSHQSWLGSGEYFLLGNSQARGRKWNEPFPSSLHFLAAITFGDVSPCGRSGRFVVGDPGKVADLRSGDGWQAVDPLSIICYPAEVGDESGPYDADLKGSPDGTKISFVSNYDLRDGPVTFITVDAAKEADRVEVASTEMFPPQGEIVVHREVIAYSRKTATSFEGLVHNKYGTSGFGGEAHAGLSAGRPVTLFEARQIPESQFRTLPKPASEIRRSIGEDNLPLLRQRSTDVYVAAIRKPDSPFLRVAKDKLELIPGENHWETFGYLLFKDGIAVTPEPVRPGATRTLESGSYSVLSVEWSGLRSATSNSIKVSKPVELSILLEQPSDFSWTRDRWVVDGKTVDRNQAWQSPDAVREILHRNDGVIAREWYNWGTLLERHDLNVEGKAIRRLTYHQGLLFKREYHTRDAEHVSTEFFDSDGSVSEMIRYRTAGGDKEENDHWWYSKGMPQRRITGNPPVMWVLSNDEWVRADHVGKRPPKQDAKGERERQISGN